MAADGQDMKPVLDPASGSRMFYFDKQDDRVVFGDIRNETHYLPDRILEINPDVVTDFRDLPYDNSQFKLVIFDPPHIYDVRPGAWLKKKYGALDAETWPEDLKKGFAECFRVLEPYGVLVFKWNEYDIPLKDVLALTPEKPIIGNRKPHMSKTHWVLFMKGSQ